MRCSQSRPGALSMEACGGPDRAPAVAAEPMSFGGCRDMRILHVVPTYVPAYRYGGPIYSVHGLCRALARRGLKVEVFTTNVDGPGDTDVALEQAVDVDGVAVWYFPSRRLRRLYWSPPMGAALRARVPDFDVMHLHSVFLWPTWAAARAAQRSGVPYLLAPRGMLVADLIRRKSRPLKGAWIRLIERRNLAGAAAVHVTTETEAREARALGLPLPRVVCVPNGVDLAVAVLREGGLPPGGVGGDYALFLGRVNWEKGLDRLVRAWAHLRGVPLLVAGNDEEGYRPVLEAIAQEAGVGDDVRFLGPVSADAKWPLLAGAALLVLTSYSENFGNVVLEAMAVGCPVVVTPEVGAAEIVRESEAGVVVDGDPGVLGPALARLLADEPRRLAMGERGRRVLQERYTWDAVAERMERVYREILSGR
jgi:glycosyltransferase involved in cell wall biosynthesis